ncbi:MAG: hydroxymethylglutaryl-CoA reductase [Bacteroidia bacterium]|nr:MAG: hydroxymethylglutaryl-CoA reductase [Bacteroidia bacterium]
MTEKKILQGFSRLTPLEKLHIAAGNCAHPETTEELLLSFLHPDPQIREILAGISENTISAYPLPYSVAPNFFINGRMYMVPMVVEESSVVAAASSAARFWAVRGGFHAQVHGMVKNGQLHFLYRGDGGKLQEAMPEVEIYLRKFTAVVTAKMEKRGGGIKTIRLKNRTDILPHYYQLHAEFDTSDAMGANFINSCLEEFASGLDQYLGDTPGFHKSDYEPLMAILSNYSDGCLVEASVHCPLRQLDEIVPGMTGLEFARRFVMAVDIASSDVYRAVTHNKGIMNGVDAVVLATGNDFRAIEAGAHAWAARSGQYRSLSRASLDEHDFHFTLTMPMALGSIGGLTRLHPLAAKSMEILGMPGARELMMIAAATGLANNFAALRSLTTTGIQAGHMRMHLSNILMQLKATPEESAVINEYFADKKVSYQAVADKLAGLRNKQ